MKPSTGSNVTAGLVPEYGATGGMPANDADDAVEFVDVAVAGDAEVVFGDALARRPAGWPVVAGRV